MKIVENGDKEIKTRIKYIIEAHEVYGGPKKSVYKRNRLHISKLYINTTRRDDRIRDLIVDKEKRLQIVRGKQTWLSLL